jgi:hypothetical protein
MQHRQRNVRWARRAAVLLAVAVPLAASSITAASAAPTSPTLVTSASGNVALGGAISDSGVLSGGNAPKGSITFRAYGPGDSNCSGSAAFTSTKTVGGNGTYHSNNFTPTAAGTYNFIASYSGDANNNGQTEPCGSNNESVTVTSNVSHPTLSTNASGNTTIGHAISDTAVLAGGSTPTGTIVFRAFGPNNSNCSGGAAFTSTVNVSNNGTFHSGNFTPNSAGTYLFVASYSGNTKNAAITSACGAANESVTVTGAHPTLSTTASASVTVGHSISDTAVLSGGVTPTGTITFNVYGPNNPNCAPSPITSSSVAVSGNGTYHSALFTPTSVGTYIYVTSYSGDSKNAGTSVVCGAANEHVTVTQVPSALALTLSSSTATYGGEQREEISASVGSGDPGASSTGTVTVSDELTGSGLCTITLSGGSGSCALTPTELLPGGYTVVGNYEGNNEVSASTSAAHHLTVIRARTHTKLRLSDRTLIDGHEHAERLSVHVHSPGLGSPPTGDVVIRGGGRQLCRITLSDGHGSCHLSHRRLSPGHYTLVAHYTGSAYIRSSHSGRHHLHVISP